MFLFVRLFGSILTHITTLSSPRPAFCRHSGTVRPSFDTQTAQHLASSAGRVFFTCSHSFQTFSSLQMQKYKKKCRKEKGKWFESRYRHKLGDECECFFLEEFVCLHLCMLHVLVCLFQSVGRIYWHRNITAHHDCGGYFMIYSNRK